MSLRWLALLVFAPALASATEPRVVGWLEPVVFPDNGLRVVAKLDTGAKTSSLDAEDVTPLDRAGERWVRFALRKKRGKGEPRWFEARVVGDRKIRTAVGEETRPLVDLWLCVAGDKRRVLFSLGTRADMNYRVILGRRALEGRLAVDSGRKFTADPACPP
jgi:hypothetical protein